MASGRSSVLALSEIHQGIPSNEHSQRFQPERQPISLEAPGDLLYLCRLHITEYSLLAVHLSTI